MIPATTRRPTSLGAPDPLTEEKPFLDPALEARHQARIASVRGARESLDRAAAVVRETERLPDRGAGGAHESAWRTAIHARERAAALLSGAVAALAGPAVERDRRSDLEFARARLVEMPDRHKAIGDLVTPKDEEAVVRAVELLAPIYGRLVRGAVAHHELDEEEGRLRKHLGEKDHGAILRGQERFAEGLERLRNVWASAVQELDPSRETFGHQTTGLRGITRLLAVVAMQVEDVTVGARERARELLTGRSPAGDEDAVAAQVSSAASTSAPPAVTSAHFEIEEHRKEGTPG